MSATARERVHAMEGLAAIIAHELRAGVLGVTSAAQLLRYSVPQDPVAEKSLGRILLEADRLSALHDALTEYATALPPRTSVGAPDDVWVTVLHELRSALDARSVRATHSPATGATVRIDREQLSRAFERIVHHAVGRVQPGAELRIASSVEGDEWLSTVSALTPAATARPDPERSSFHLLLAQRTIVAHGGEVTDHPAADTPLLVGVRLPLSLHAE